MDRQIVLLWRPHRSEIQVFGQSRSLPSAGWVCPPTTQWAFRTHGQTRGTEQRLWPQASLLLLRHCPPKVPPLWPHFLGTFCVSLYFSCSLSKTTIISISQMRKPRS